MNSNSAPPHLVKGGPLRRLIVDNQPFLILGGEVHNSSTSNLDYIELLEVDEGKFVNKQWVSTRRLNGDETDSGAHVVFPADGLTIQKIKLFRHD